MSYKAVFELEVLEEGETFRDVFVPWWNLIKERVIKEGYSFQALETASWIETGGRFPLMFYDAKEEAYRQGIIDDKGNVIE